MIRKKERKKERGAKSHTLKRSSTFVISSKKVPWNAKSLELSFLVSAGPDRSTRSDHSSL